VPAADTGQMMLTLRAERISPQKVVGSRDLRCLLQRFGGLLQRLGCLW
jgi:hypothetical protein